jgi:RimJ/RimL family protein N-acetyltransferase
MARLEIPLGDDGLRLRPFAATDVAPLVKYANNPRVTAGLLDRFPYPYTPAHAVEWVKTTRQSDPPTALAIATPQELIGGVGFDVGELNFQRTAEIGYWLGEPFWGRGIATRALVAMTAYAFERFDLARLQAGVFENNPASMRVLEKAGYHREARLAQAVTKLGETMDLVLYVRLRS